ncbi:polysaccharide biosynthesis tyrosine autokinase [Nocardioides dubius]|uniref:non-specific protein-tyrosine kinase n=1 Tax=Nocardioides dubius TaxID=317019 RepID=A0ABP4EM97_9ACTN
MDLKDYWLTVRSRWRSIVVCLLLSLGVAYGVTSQMTPQYASSAQLFISTTPSDTSDAYQGNMFATQRVTSYARVVTTHQMAERVNDVLGADFDADELKNKVEATIVPETVMLEITATDADPEVARNIAQAYAETLSEMVRELETVDGADGSLISASIVDDARVSESPVSPNLLRNLGLAGLLGLLLGLGIAVLRELMDSSISSTADVEAVTGAPVVGQLLSDASSASQQPALALEEPTPWAESFRVLRTNMQFVEVDTDHKVFVMTSSVPAEGKTTTAINLAVTLAMAGQKVVLVECDLRRPQVADRLNLEPAVGTTSVLVGKLELDDALQPYGRSGLEVLASGPIPPNPSELLQSHAMEKLLADLRARFDVVILDAPPLLPVTDAALLAAQANGAVVVTRYGKTTQDQLRHSMERLEQVDARPLGVVINRTPLKTRGTSYGYGYGYAPLAEASTRKQRRSEQRAAKKEDAAKPRRGSTGPTQPFLESQD